MINLNKRKFLVKRGFVCGYVREDFNNTVEPQLNFKDIYVKRSM